MLRVVDPWFDGLLQSGIEKVGAYFARRAQVRPVRHAADALVHQLGDQDRVLGDVGGFAKGFQNGTRIPD
jgi:hypothetical protein